VLAQEGPSSDNSKPGHFGCQLQAKSFLFLVQRHGLLPLTPGLQNQGLFTIAGLQTFLVAQLEAERFLFLEQLKSLFQSTSGFQDQGLVAVAALQTFLIVQLKERMLPPAGQCEGRFTVPLLSFQSRSPV